MNGSTLGILGLGGIGLETAKRGLGFDMKIIYHSRTRKPELEKEYGFKYASFNRVLAQSDFLSIHVPLTTETHHFIGEKQLKKMKSTAILVNLSRGPVVNTDALLAALQDDAIAGAGIDVTAPEPIPPDHPLLKQSNLVITPHLGSATHATRIRMAMLAAENAIAACSGGIAPNAL